MEPDFTGYATKANLKCSDGRTIMPDAFKHQDQETVPLVWQHARNEPSNVLGHAVLENRSDGVYCRAYFNDSDSGKSAKKLVSHGDIKSLSIYANQLVEKSKNVVHGMIREVSLVLAGANPGALIDYVNVVHADGSVQELDTDAVITTGLSFEHWVGEDQDDEEENPEEKEEAVSENNIEHAGEETVKDIFDSMSDKQKEVVYFMIGQALKGDGSSAQHEDVDIQEVFHSLNDDQKNVVYFMIGEALETAKDNAKDNANDSVAHEDNQEGTIMKHNVFESDNEKRIDVGSTLTHSQTLDIFKAAKRKGSLKDAVEDFAADTLEHGIEDIDVLFPDAKAVTSTPDFLKRRTEWVNGVLTETRHTPFSRIKSMLADLTLEAARAKGYVKGNLKKEEFFRVSKRVTTPQTIYKKQKLDRDDILDITDFDVVAWLKGEMRLMLDEEIARAVLIGDGRSADDEDKIQEEHIRPIATDHDLYVTRLYVNLDDDKSSAEELIDALTLNRRHYRGSGNPTFYTSETMLAKLLLIKDTLGRRIYQTTADLQAALRVSKIVTAEILDEEANDVVGIMVNLADYTIGADRGGDVTLFEDFDIDYNQEKYLIETRLSGALTRAKSALVVLRTKGTDVLVDPVAPSWNGTNHTVTVANTTGIVYKNKETNQTLTSGSPVTLAPGDELTVIAVPSSGYYLASNVNDEFKFDYDRGRVGDAF